MQLVIDTDLQIAVAGLGSRAPAATIELKGQDTLNLDLYFVSAGVVQDLTSGASMKFGLVSVAAQGTLLVLTTAFARMVDANGNVFYRGQPIFSTSQMVAALTGPTLACLGEVRYQLSDGEIVHTLNIPFQIDATLIPETGSAPPSVVATYPDVSTIELKANRDQSSGYAALSSAGFLKPTDFDPAVVELIASRNVPSGHAGLDSAGLILGSEIPVDGTTTAIVAGKLTAIGASANLTDAETTAGITLIQSAVGVLNRIIAGTGITFDVATTPGGIIINAAAVAGGVASLTDAETTTGQTLISATTGILKRLVAGTNITFDTTTTPGAIIISASGTTGVASLTDAETSSGQTLIQTSSGVLKRIVAGAGILFDALTTPGAVIIKDNLADAETTAGASLLASAGFLKRIIAGTNVTLDIATTTGGIIINAAGAALTDAETSTGLSIISSTAGVLKRLVAGTNVTIDAVTTPGAIIINGTSSGVASLTDAETTTGLSIISSAAGILRRLVAGTNITIDAVTTPGAIILNGASGAALTDAETTTGQTIISNASGILKRLVAGTNVTLDVSTTPGAIIINATAGGAGVAALSDAETTTGQSLVAATSGVIKRIIPGANISLDTATTAGGIIINETNPGAIGTFASFTIPAAYVNVPVTVSIPNLADLVAGGGGQSLILSDGTSWMACTIVSAAGNVLTCQNNATQGSSVSGTMGAGRVYLGSQPKPDGNATHFLNGVGLFSAPASGGALTPDLGIECFDDFISGNSTVAANYYALGWGTLISGGSVGQQSIVGVTAAGKAAGVVDLNCGTTAGSNFASLYLSGNGATVNNFIIPRLGILTCTWRVWVGALHTTADYTIFRIGLYSVFGSNIVPIDGLYFTYNRLTSANWCMSTSSASTETKTAGSVAVTAAAWHKLTITTDATWANISFLVDGVSIGTALTTNIPANTVMLPMMIGGTKTLGATQHVLSADYMYLKYAYTVGR